MALKTAYGVYPLESAEQKEEVAEKWAPHISETSFSCSRTFRF